MVTQKHNALIIKDKKQYNRLRAKHDENAAASKAWREANNTNGIPLEVCANFPHAKEVTNELRSALEVWQWLNDEPKEYFLYIYTKEGYNNATTWMGDVLGKVYFGREYRSNFGDVRVPIDVHGTNGIKYHGTYYKGTGDYARIKAYKNQ